MKNSKLAKILSIFIIIVILLSNIYNVSYAATITKDELKKSFEKLFLNYVKIETKHYDETTGEQSSSSSSTYSPASKIDFEDKTIKLTYEENDEQNNKTSSCDLNLEYSINSSIAFFENVMNVSDYQDILNTNLSTINDPTLILCILNYTLFSETYLSMADLYGKDLTLAETYFEQNSKTTEETNYYKIATDIATITINYIKVNDVLETVDSYMEINIEKLENLDSNQIKNTSVSEVTISATEPVSNNNTNNNTNTNTNNNTNTNTNTNTNNNTNTNTNTNINTNINTNTNTNINTNTNNNLNTNIGNEPAISQTNITNENSGNTNNTSKDNTTSNITTIPKSGTQIELKDILTIILIASIIGLVSMIIIDIKKNKE